MKTWIVASALVMLVTAVPAAQQPQVSLGDLSKQTETERATRKKAAKSYTNKDLTPDPNAAAATDQAPADGYISASTGQKVSPEELITRSQEKLDAESVAALPEAHWRQRADYLRAEFARAQERMDKLRAAPQPPSLPARARLEQDVTMIRQMVTGLTKQWDRLAESARVAKVPNDWIGEKPVFNQ